MEAWQRPAPNRSFSNGAFQQDVVVGGYYADDLVRRCELSQERSICFAVRGDGQALTVSDTPVRDPVSPYRGGQSGSDVLNGPRPGYGPASIEQGSQEDLGVGVGRPLAPCFESVSDSDESPLSCL